jgi:hypothetical protein
VHGSSVANSLPPFEKRDTNGGRAILKEYNEETLGDLRFGNLLNRPQSALSRQLLMAAIKCATSEVRLESILGYAKGGSEILQDHRADNLRRFRLILLGVRAHGIADTWAHQDFCGLNNVMNTHWDVNYDPNSWNPLHLGYGETRLLTLTLKTRSGKSSRSGSGQGAANAAPFCFLANPRDAVVGFYGSVTNTHGATTLGSIGVGIASHQ